MSVCTSSSEASGCSPAAMRAPTAASTRSSVLLSSSVSTLAPHNATAHALERRMSYGQSRKSTPLELLSASNSGVGPAPKRPPHSLCDLFTLSEGAPRSLVAGRVALLIDVVFAEGDEALVVQRVLALASHHLHAALEQAQRHRAGDALLRDVHEGIVRLALGRPPPALVHEVGVARRDEIFGRERRAFQHEL